MAVSNDSTTQIHRPKDHPVEYRIRAGIIARCTNPNYRYWKNYGGRGISICRAWRESFSAFYSDVGPRPSSDHSIDRIDNDGNYEPGNVRWASRLLQAQNRRNVHMLTHDGATMHIRDWAKRLSLSATTLHRRYHEGERPPYLFRPAPEQRIYVTHDGVTLSLRDWGRKFGLTANSIEKRYRRGDRPPRLFRAASVSECVLHCAVCGVEFIAKRTVSVYCSKRCKYKSFISKHGPRVRR